jgi:hypothetical protein
MRCGGFIGIQLRKFAAFLLVGLVCLPLAGRAADTSTDQSAAQTQESASEQGAATQSGGESGEKKEGAEEEPDC